MNKFEKVRAKLLIDFHNQKVIIKYLRKNNFRKVDIYRDANCIARCIAAKVFKDESKYNNIKYGVYKQIKTEFIMAVKYNIELGKYKNKELFKK